MRINSLSLRTIYTSRVNATVEAEVNGSTAAAPSGASTGRHEAHCHVPEDLSAVEDRLQNALVGEDLNQSLFDEKLTEVDGTGNFAELGAAAIASSFAFKKSIGIATDEIYPYPLGNIVGGGAHGGNTDIQEFLVIPSQADSIPDAMAQLADMYYAFREQYGTRIRGINDEGAYVTNMDDEATLNALRTLADEFGADLGVDIAASEFCENDVYYWDALGIDVGPAQQTKFVADLVDQFGLVYVEDPMHEDDFEHTAMLTDRVDDCLIVGDDLFVTQRDRLRDGNAVGAGNGIIIKPNQIGTITDTEDTLAGAEQHGYTPIVSHRSGETCDPIIADLAREWQTPLIKAGISGIRTAKNNQLLREWDRAPGTMADLPF